MEAVVERQQRMLAQGGNQGFLVRDSTVERRVFGPIGASSTQSRFRHFITISG